jgi:hypothetical protein
MTKPLVIDRERARTEVSSALAHVLSERVAKRLTDRVLAALERAVAPKAPAPPTELERARAREIARRAGLRVRGTR